MSMTFSENDGNHVRFCILINRVSVRMEPIIDHHSLTSKKMNNSNNANTIHSSMTDEERDTILLRIRKLLNLQENAAKIGSEGEAYAAAQGVHRLLTMYNLSMDEVPLGEEKKSIDITETEMFSYADGYGTWKRELLTVICMFNFCHCLSNSFTKRVCIVGEKQNVIIVRQLYDYLVMAFKRLAREKWETRVTLYGSNNFVSIPFDMAERKYGKDKKPLFLKSYYTGAWCGLKEQFESLQPTSEETALMVVHDEAINDYLSHDEHYTGEGRYRKGNDDMDYAAFSQGIVDGRSISLSRQLDKKDKKEITWKKK